MTYFFILFAVWYVSFFHTLFLMVLLEAIMKESMIRWVKRLWLLTVPLAITFLFHMLH